MNTSNLDAQIIARQHGEITDLRARLEKAEAERDAWLKEIPDELADAIKNIGRVEWGATDVKSDEGHIEDLRTALAGTRDYFKTEGETAKHGVYIEGEDIVLCHTGTSPNSPNHARIIAGFWNWALASLKSNS